VSGINSDNIYISQPILSVIRGGRQYQLPFKGHFEEAHISSITQHQFPADEESSTIFGEVFLFVSFCNSKIFIDA
jgi:hypothetical protein